MMKNWEGKIFVLTYDEIVSLELQNNDCEEDENRSRRKITHK